MSDIAWRQWLWSDGKWRESDRGLIQGRELFWCDEHDDRQYGDKTTYCQTNWDGGASAACEMRLRFLLAAKMYSPSFYGDPEAPPTKESVTNSATAPPPDTGLPGE